MSDARDVIDVEILGVFVDEVAGTAVVLLAENAAARRVLPIVVGQAEAESIVVGLSSIDLPRPNTHDLFLRTVDAAHGRIRAVRVVALERGTFIGELEVDLSDRLALIDARPSDCIGVAIRAEVPIRVSREVFDRASVEFGEPSTSQLDAEQIDRIMSDFRSFLDDAEPQDFVTGSDPLGAEQDEQHGVGEAVGDEHVREHEHEHERDDDDDIAG